MIVGKHCMSLSILLVSLSGCATFSSSPFSPTLEAQVTPAASFSQVAQDPSGHRGRIVKVGGVVLSAKRLTDRTEVRVLQIPLDLDSIPKWNRNTSQGRFIATQEVFLDPATLPKGTRVTIIGEVTGDVSDQVEAEGQGYPIIVIKALKVWPMILRNGYGYRPSWVPYPYWGSYWGSYWGFPRSSFGFFSRRYGGGHRSRR